MQEQYSSRTCSTQRVVGGAGLRLQGAAAIGWLRGSGLDLQSSVMFPCVSVLLVRWGRGTVVLGGIQRPVDWTLYLCIYCVQNEAYIVKRGRRMKRVEYCMSSRT